MATARRTLAGRAAVVISLCLATAARNQRAAAFTCQISTARARTGAAGERRSVLAADGRRLGLGRIHSSRRGASRSTNDERPWRTWTPSSRSAPYVGVSRLGMVASSPIDAPDSPPPPQQQQQQRPRLPAERGINAGMNGFNAGVVNFLKGLMVTYYGERTYARFYALETIARVPYFGYLCVLHLYETLGQWRQAEYLKVHFAESYNELHHLLIMEELGGNLLFKDRWFAQHAAFFYFFVVVGLYLSNPRNAYNLNQHVEEHAFSTYDSYLSENEDKLKAQPAPLIAKKYYGTDKLYVFNGLHNDPDGPTFEERDLARPVISNLFDTFVAVRNDEWEHVKTMKALQKDVLSEITP